MVVQYFEMCAKVKFEKLQNDPNLVGHSIFVVLMSEFTNDHFSLLSVIIDARYFLSEDYLILLNMIPYLSWWCLTWKCCALKCGVRSNLKSCKVTEVWWVAQFLSSWWVSFQWLFLPSLSDNRCMRGTIVRLFNSLLNDTITVMIMSYMEVQCFEMWGDVKFEKLLSDPSLVGHSIFVVRVDEWVSRCLHGFHAFYCEHEHGFKQTCAQTMKRQTNKQTWPVCKNRTQSI